MFKARTYTGLGNLPERYEKLFAEASQDSFFLSLPWFRILESSVLGSNEIVQIIGVESDGPSDEALGALVLKISKDTPQFFLPRTVNSLTNYYSSYFAPILARNSGSLDEVVQMIVGELKSRSPRWDILNIRPLDISLSGVQSLHSALEASGIKTQAYFCFANWYLDVKGRSYSEYLESLPSVLRETIRRKGNRLQKLGNVTIAVLNDLHRCTNAVEDFVKVYVASWKRPEPYPKFIPQLIRTCAANAWMRLGMVYVDDEPVASQLWIVKNRIASIYKLAYDERFAKFSVGTVLTARMMQHVIDIDKVSIVDYLTGDEAYKRDWMSHRRERWGIMAFNPATIMGNISTVKHIGGKYLKAKLALAHDMMASFKGLPAGEGTNRRQ